MTSTAASARARLRYLVILSRPRFWLYLAGPVLVGVAFGVDALSALVTPVTLALFAYFLLPANVFLYGVNDLFDADVDAENPKKDGREARWEGDAFVLAAVAAAGLLGVGLFAAVPRVAWLPLAAFFALGVEYSAPPLRFKTTPFLDSASNGLYAMPGVAAYAAVAGALPPALALWGAWAWTMAMHTFSAVPDIGPDRRAGIRTTATVLGETATLAYCGLLWSVAALAFGLLDVRLGALLAVYPLAVVGVALADVDVARAYWWYPALNTAVGGLMTVGALWVVVYG